MYDSTPRNKFNRFILLIFLLVPIFGWGQPAEQFIKVIVAPDHANWIYSTGDKVYFNVTVLRGGNPLKNVQIRYQVGPEKMEPTITDSAVAEKGILKVDAGNMRMPGFLRCVATVTIDNKTYRGIGTSAIDPQKIIPSIDLPTAFETYWDQAKTELSKIPIDARMTLLPERCTENVNVFHLNLQNFRSGSRLYGILCVPKKDGKYPAILRVPGAGVRAYAGDIANAEKGFITLEIGIHGIPVNLDPGVYSNLASGSLFGYWNLNLDDKDRYYYKRVYMGCVRANDFLVSLPQFDGANLGVTGGSQGGALAIITGALDSRVKFLTAFYPALSDVTGYLQGRAGGWPHLFDKTNFNFNNTKQKIETAGFYDVVNFARRLKIPGMYSWGFNDETCPPTSMYAVYNSITSPKELFLVPETGHWTYPEQQEKLTAWLHSKLKSK